MTTAGGGWAGTGRAEVAGRDPLLSDDPWRDRRLWLVQLAVAAAYLVRMAVEMQVTRAHSPVPGIPDFSTLGLFLWPVLYAAVTVGPTGAAVTAAWVAALSVPRDLAFLHGGDPVAVWAESTQVAALCLVAVVVGRRVAAERRASARAERARRAHLAAEARYRALFDASVAPTALVDRRGTVVEVNAAGAAVRGRRPATLADLVGPPLAARALRGEAVDGEVVVAGRGPSRRLLRLAVTALGPPAGADDGPAGVRGGAPGDGAGPGGAGSPDEGLLQVVLTDVTAESERRETAEAFAQAVVDAQEEERRHLAQELHDGPLQSLVHLVRQLDAAGVPPELRGLGLGLVDELRRIARGLRPSVLDDLGLVAALQRLLDDVAGRSAVDTSLGVTGRERRLPSPAELALFRVAQEAVSNAERHAAPTRIAVGLGFEAGRVRLLVTDDGRGFDPADPAAGRRRGSLGMSGMGERLQLAGGSLTVHSAPGAGTTVEAVVPVASPPRAEEPHPPHPDGQVESPIHPT